MHYLYIIENVLEPSKLYVGITKNDPTKRWQRHRATARSNDSRKMKYLHYAMNAVGENNFIFNVIQIFSSFEECLHAEHDWITYLKSQNLKLYNMTEGGDVNYFHGKQLFGKANGHYGKKMKRHVRDILLQYRAKLSYDEVAQIRKLYGTGNYTQTELSKMFNISLSQTHRIVKNKRWHTGEKPKEKPNLKIEQVKEMKRLYATGTYKQTELAAIYDITADHVNAIINGRKWKNI